MNRMIAKKGERNSELTSREDKGFFFSQDENKTIIN